MSRIRVAADVRPFEVTVVASVLQESVVGVYYLGQMPVQDLLSDRYRAAEPSVVVDSQTEPPAALFGEIILDGRVVDAFASSSGCLRFRFCPIRLPL